MRLNTYNDDSDKKSHQNPEQKKRLYAVSLFKLYSVYCLNQSLIILVLIFALVSGTGIPFVFAQSIHFNSQDIFSPRFRIVCKPSSSFKISSGLLPNAIFQYVDDTSGISAIVAYLFKVSIAAVVPARRATATIAAGLCENHLFPA